jgi:hypothetical protein
MFDVIKIGEDQTLKRVLHMYIMTIGERNLEMRTNAFRQVTALVVN